MFSIFNSSKRRIASLPLSEIYNEKSFYDRFSADLRRANSEVIIESPFLACKRTDDLLPELRKLCKRGVKVRINTRNPNHHDKELRIQAWVAIKKLRQTGVKVKTYDDMRHRKLATIDELVLWEGSLIIMSQSYSKEMMRRTESGVVCKQMIQFTGINRWGWWYD